MVHFVFHFYNLNSVDVENSGRNRQAGRVGRERVCACACVWGGGGDKGGTRMGWISRLFVPRPPHPPLALPGAWCLASRVISCHNDHCHPRISTFHRRGGNARVCASVSVPSVRLLAPGRIMQGLGKTERGDPGRDLDRTSLRSTMPAGGPLQVSAPWKREKTACLQKRARRVETEGTDAGGRMWST